jgi:hypothetical protein
MAADQIHAAVGTGQIGSRPPAEEQQVVLGAAASLFDGNDVRDLKLEVSSTADGASVLPCGPNSPTRLGGNLSELLEARQVLDQFSKLAQRATWNCHHILRLSRFETFEFRPPTIPGHSPAAEVVRMAHGFIDASNGQSLADVVKIRLE